MVDLAAVRSALEGRELIDVRARTAELSMSGPGVLRLRREPLVIARTELRRLTRMATARLRSERDDELVLRTWRGQVLGVVSPRYVPVSHTMVVDALQAALAGSRFRLHAFAGNWHLLRILLVDRTRRIEARVGDVSHGGIEVLHSETGWGPLEIGGFLLRLVCQNGATIAVPLSASSQPHRGDFAEALIHRFRSASEEVGAAVQHELDELKDLAATRLSPALARAVQRKLASQLSTRSMQRLRASLPPRATVYDLYNAITARAQRRGLLGRRGLEALGGELIHIHGRYRSEELNARA